MKILKHTNAIKFVRNTQNVWVDYYLVTPNKSITLFTREEGVIKIKSNGTIALVGDWDWNISPYACHGTQTVAEYITLYFKTNQKVLNLLPPQYKWWESL